MKTRVQNKCDVVILKIVIFTLTFFFTPYFLKIFRTTPRCGKELLFSSFFPLVTKRRFNHYTKVEDYNTSTGGNLALNYLECVYKKWRKNFGKID